MSKTTTHLTMYLTAHCSLCERALEQLFEIDIPSGLKVTTKDISVSAALVEEFGERIPVLQCDDLLLEAPFDKDELEAWISSLPRF